VCVIKARSALLSDFCTIFLFFVNFMHFHASNKILRLYDRKRTVVAMCVDRFCVVIAKLCWLQKGDYEDAVSQEASTACKLTAGRSQWLRGFESRRGMDVWLL